MSDKSDDIEKLMEEQIDPEQSEAEQIEYEQKEEEEEQDNPLELDDGNPSDDIEEKYKKAVEYVNETSVEQYSPDSPRFEDEFNEDGIPVIDDEEQDYDLHEDLEDRGNEMIQEEKDKLLEFTTDFNTDDLLLVVFFDKNKYEDYLGVITDITDTYIILNDERNIYYSEGYIQLLHKDYTIIDIVKIQEVDLDILDEEDIFKEDKIELEEQVKSKKERVYTDTEIKEDFISNLIGIYDIYDNENLIHDITETSEALIYLINKVKYRTDIDDQDNLNFVKEFINTNQLNIPSFILPIVGMKKMIFDDTLSSTEDIIVTSFEEEFVRKYNILNETDDFSSKGYINYMNNLFSDDFESYKNDTHKFGVNINYSGLVIRDCFNDINPCNSLSNKYSLDFLNIRNNLNIIHNYETNPIVEERNINVIGFLFVPLNKINDIKNVDLNNSLYNLNDVIKLSKEKDIRNILKSSYINSIDITDDTVRSEYEQAFNKYLFRYDKQLTIDKFKAILNNLPSNSDIFDSLNYPINNDADIYLVNLFHNYNDAEKVLNLLDMSLNDINYDKKSQLNRYINNTVNEYKTNYNKSLKKYIKPIKPLKKITKNLDVKEKIKLCQELIFSQTDLIYRYSLLSKFISIYGREANKGSEDKSFYYDKTSDSEKLICKHYLYLIKGDKDSYDTMKSIYGEVSKDGNVYCKKCNRFISYDDFSTFEGFSDGKPSSSKEKAEDIEESLNFDKKEIKESYDIIKYISEKFNIVLQNDDMIKIINIYNLLDHKNLYDQRYNSDIIKTHPILKNNKSKPVIASFKEFLHNINNILSAIFLIFIHIQISNNSYNINFNNRINIINSDSSWNNLFITDKESCLNMKVITYIEAKLKSLVKKYPKEKIFNNVNELFNEFDTLKTMKISFKDHFINVIRYWMNPQYILHSRLEKYFIFESGINKNYIRDYWTTYKPLPDNRLIKHINEYVQSNNELYKQYFVNNNSIQNISLLKPINNDEPKYQELDIKLSELMNNPSFKRLYTYALKGYGKADSFPILNLLTKQFVNTFTPSHKKELITILSKCNYNHERGEYSSINFNIKSSNSIRNVFLNDIIGLDIKKDSDNIRKYQYINLNNHEYFLLNSNVNRHYSYTPPNVYITHNYDDLLENDSSILKKMYKYYCLDKSDNLIPNMIKEIDGEIINTNIINFLLLDYNEDLISNISECNKEIPNTAEYFHIILNYLINKNQLKLLHSFIPYTEYYSNEFILNNINKNILIESRISDFFDNYCDETDEIYDLIENMKDYFKLIMYKKDNNELIDKIELSGQYDLLINKIIINNKLYIKNIDELYNKLIQNELYSQFNPNQIENMRFKLNKKEQTELERSLGFIPDTNISYFINKIIQKLDDKNMSDRTINSIYYYLSFLKNTSNGDFNPMIKKKEWKMSDSKIGYISDYLNKNTFLLHNEIFLRNKDKDFESGNKYAGFNEYRKPHYDIFFTELYNYINKYRKDIYKLKINNELPSYNQKIFNIFIFLFNINKISEYINLLLDDTTNEYAIMNKKCDSIENIDITIEKCIIVLSRFLLDILINIHDKLYDTNWIYIDKDTYKNKLDEHNAREKQTNLDRLDHMTDEQRRLHVANQSIRSGIMYKESEKINLERKVGGERDQQIMEEREEQKKNIFEETVNSEETISDNILQDHELENIDPGADDDGYYDQNDFAAEGEEDEDNLDALQLNEGD